MDNLRLAFYKAQKQKQEKQDVQVYRENLQENLLLLQRQILSGDIDIGNYHLFNIHDPKERVICAASFPERVLHHALMNVCLPRFEKNFISHTYANRVGKGVYAAINDARKLIKSNRFVAKMDVRKYFDSINHKILKIQLRRLFKDKRLLDIFDQIIDSYSVTDGCGLPIGNLTSQFFANFYLSSLDHSVSLGYVRYMDDILLFANDRQTLLKEVHKLELFASEQLKLSFKPPIIHTADEYTDFLGYRLSHNRLTLNKRSRLRFKKKYNLYTSYFEDGLWSEEEYIIHIRPLFAFCEKAYTKSFREVQLRRGRTA